jgi:hypothetical protein
MLNRSDGSDEIPVMRYESWQPMKAIGIDSTILSIDSANYHIASDKILFLQNGKLYEVYHDRTLMVYLAKQPYIRSPEKTEDGKIQSHYYEILETGEYTLLARYGLKKKVTNSHPMGVPGTGEEEYYQVEDHFYLKPGTTYPQEVPTKKDAFLDIFRKNKSKMMNYAREHKISLRSVEDLKEIFAYYNRLAAQS